MDLNNQFLKMRDLVPFFSEGNFIDFLKWTDVFTKAVNLLNFGEKIALLLFPYFLQGTACLRFKIIPKKKKKTWQKVVNNMMIFYQSSIDHILAEDELGKINQGNDKISDYAGRVRLIGGVAYAQLHKKCRERLLASHFLRNANFILKRKLLTLKPIPTTLDEMISKAEEIQITLGTQSDVLEPQVMEHVYAIASMLRNVTISESAEETPMFATVNAVTEDFEEAENCYFHIERKSAFETHARYEKCEVTVNCSKKLMKMSELNAEGIDLFGAPDGLSLLVFRGSGIEVQSTEDWASKHICSNHLDELLLQWHRNRYNHTYRKNRLLKEVPLCSVPDSFGQPHANNRPQQNKKFHVLTFLEANTILQKYGFLLHPGIPLCPSHKELAESCVTGLPLVEVNDSFEDHNETNFTNDDGQGYDGETSNARGNGQSHKGHNSPLEKAVFQLATLAGVQRIKPLIPFELMANRTQRKKAQSIRIIIDAIISIVAPGSEKVLANMIFKTETDQSNFGNAKLHELLCLTASEFRLANGRYERNVVLSMVAKVIPRSEVARYIPGITYHVYDQARRLVTYSIDLRKRHIVKYDPPSVNLFLQFITSNAVMSPFTYGVKKTRCTDGRVVELPNTIRKQTHSQIVAMFRLYVKSRTELNEVFVRWEKDGEIDNAMRMLFQKQLENAVYYLRTEYRIHVKTSSRIADHCCIYGLSDPTDASLRQNCDHQHDIFCDSCEAVKTFFQSIEKKSEEIIRRLSILAQQKDANAKELLNEYRHDEYTLNRCKNYIESFKKHVLRSCYTDNQRSNIVHELEDNEAMLTLDFAQKLLVQKHYESQLNYFGKRGMSYHVTHVLAKIEGQLVSHSFVHILRGDLQDHLAVTAILDHALRELKKMGLKTVTLRSDNAANYHCNPTISSLIFLSETTGVRIKRYAFSEAQNGKSSCDRIASVVKRKVRTFVDSGSDIETVDDFMKALKKYPLNASSIFLASVERPKSTEKSNIKNISSIFDIQVEKNHILVNRYDGIGSGTTLQKKTLVPNRSKLIIEQSSELRASEDLSKKERIGLKNNETTEFWHSVQTKNEKKKQSSDYNAPVATPVERGNALYIPCPNNGCLSEFRLLSNLEKHLEIGNHKYRSETKSLRDTVIESYNTLANDFKNEVMPVAVQDVVQDIINAVDANGEVERQGWALQKRKAAKRFNEKQKAFLLDLFTTGAQNKAKFDGKKAEILMRKKLDKDGNPFFELEDLLESAQIDSYFSRLAFKKRTEPHKSRTKKSSGKPSTSSKVDHSDDDTFDDSDDEDENSPDFALLGFKDAQFPDLLTEAQNIVRQHSEDMFEEETNSRRSKHPRLS